MIVFYTRLAFYTSLLIISLFNFSTRVIAQTTLADTDQPPLDIESHLFESRDFSVTRGDGGEVRLNWQTKFEKRESYVEIERSFDQKDYQTIAIMFGPENLEDGGSKYEFRDKGLQTKAPVFYRLRLITDEHHYQYSKVAIVPSTNLN